MRSLRARNSSVNMARKVTGLVPGSAVLMTGTSFPAARPSPNWLFTC